MKHWSYYTATNFGDVCYVLCSANYLEHCFQFKELNDRKEACSTGDVCVCSAHKSCLTICSVTQSALFLDSATRGTVNRCAGCGEITLLQLPEVFYLQLVYLKKSWQVCIYCSSLYLIRVHYLYIQHIHTYLLYGHACALKHFTQFSSIVQKQFS